MSNENVITADKLTKRFGRFTAVDHISFEVKKGVLPDALQVLPAHLVDFKLGKERYSDSTIKYGTNEYKVSQVIRDFVADPSNPFYGRSVVTAAAASVDVDQQMQSWNRRTFANNARPGLVFNLQGENIEDGAR